MSVTACIINPALSNYMFHSSHFVYFTISSLHISGASSLPNVVNLINNYTYYITKKRYLRFG